MKLPVQVEEALDIFRVTLELDAWNVHVSCYGKSGVYWQIAFLMVWPAVAICLTPAIGLVLALLFKQTTPRELWARGRRRGDRGLIDTVLLRYAMPLTMLILFFAFPPVTSLAFRTFEACTTFSDEMGEGQSYLVSSRKNFAVACPSDELKHAQSLAWVAIILYPVGVVVLCAWLLYLGRAKLLLDEQSTPYTRSIAFLHAPFVPAYFYFDLLELSKKLCAPALASFHPLHGLLPSSTCSAPLQVAHRLRFAHRARVAYAAHDCSAGLAALSRAPPAEPAVPKAHGQHPRHNDQPEPGRLLLLVRASPDGRAEV